MTKRGLCLYLPVLICLFIFSSHVVAQTGLSTGLTVGDPEWGPVVTLPDDSTVVWCESDSICYQISAWDPDTADSISMSLVSGPIDFTPKRFGREFTTTVCFTPAGSGVYPFIWRFEDRQHHVVIDTVVYTVDLGAPPVIEDQQFSAELCNLQPPRILSLAYDANGRTPSFRLLDGPGTIDASTGVITYEPDTSGTFAFRVAISTNCGSDTATITDQLVLNLPPYCIGFDTTIYLCNPEKICFNVLARDPEGDPINITMPEGLGTFVQTSDSTGQTCFTPRDADSTRYYFIFRAADSCALSKSEKLIQPYCCYDTVLIDVVITRPGELACPADTTIKLCVPPETLPVDICLPGFTSTWKNTTISLGTLKRDTLCFKADTLGVYIIRYAGSDTCGHADTCITRVAVEGNHTPYVTMADDYSLSLCAPEAVCFRATADDDDFDIARVSLNYGTFDQSSSLACFNADTSGTYTIIMTAEDQCTAWDTDTTRVTVTVSDLPTVSLGEDRQIELCDPQLVCLDAVVTGENLLYVGTSSGAYYNPETDKICFTPQSSGTYEVFLLVVDNCDRVVADTVVVDVSIGSAPSITGFADTTVYLCYPREICLNAAVTDPDNDIVSVTVNRGKYVNGQVCFVPYTMGTCELIITAADRCGHVVKDTAQVLVKTDQVIQLVTPGDTTIFLCEPDTLCFPIGGIPDNARVTVKGIAAYWDPTTKSICFYSDCCLENKLTVSATTECGTYSKSFTVSVQTNSRPLVMLPKDTSVFLCQPGKVCLPVGISDIDGNIANIAVTGGQYNAYDRTICFDPSSEGSHIIGVSVTDSCGAVSTAQMTVNVDFNEAPVLEASMPDTLFRQCDLSDMGLHLTATDTDDNLADFSLPGTDYFVQHEPGRFVISARYEPPDFGHHTLVGIVTDKCGLADTITLSFTIVRPEPVTITCPEAINNIQCGPGQFCADIPITGDIKQVTTNIGHWTDDKWCINVTQPISGNLQIIAVGECNTDTCTVPLNLIPVESPQLVCPADVDTLLCPSSYLEFEVPLLNEAGPNESITVSMPASVNIVGRTAHISIPVSDPGQHVVTLTYSNPPCEPYVCSFNINARLINPPKLHVEDVTTESCSLSEVCVHFTYTATEDSIESIWAFGAGQRIAATWSNGIGQFCFTPTRFGNYQFGLEAYSCSFLEAAVVNVTINELQQVAIQCPDLLAPYTYCEPADYCIDLPIDGDLTSVTTNYGSWANGKLCFNFAQPGSYNIQVIATGQCNVDTCNIPVVYLTPVGVTCSITDTTLMMCAAAATTVRVPVNITGDNVQVDVRPNTYTYADGVVNVTFSSAGQYPVRVVAWNDCSRDSCSFTVSATVNVPPVVTLPQDTVITQCVLSEICIPFSVSDADSNLTSVSSSIGTIRDGQVCFTPGVFDYQNIVVTATDACGATTSAEIVVWPQEGSRVTMTCPDPVISININLPGTVRIPVGIEPRNVAVTVSPSGYYDAATGDAVVTIASEGLHQFVVRAQADCNVDSCRFALQVGQYVPPLVECTGAVDTLLCLSRPREVCLPVRVYGTGVQVHVTPPAVYKDGAVCLDVSQPGAYVIDIMAYTDRDTATCQTVLTVTGGRPPVLNMPATLNYTLCGAGEVCFDVTMEDAEFDITNINVNYGAYDINKGQICFRADTAGTYMIEMTVADSCGNATTKMTAATIDFNAPPRVSLGDDRRVFGCALSEICVDVTIVSDNQVTISTNLGQYNPETRKVCFVPAQAGNYDLTVEVTDQCGRKASDTIRIQVDANDPPVIAPLRDTTVYLCYPRTICLEANVTDPDGNLATVTTSRGTYANGQICFAPYSMGEYQVIVTATDSCGATTKDTTVVTVRTDQGINLVTPGDTTIFLCEPDTLCFPVGGVPDGATVKVKGIAAWWNPQTKSICFFSDCCLENKLTVSVTTPCGTYSRSFTVSVQTNSRPLVLLPRDTTVLQCQLERICLPVGISDIDGNVRHVDVTGATYDAYSRLVCFTPTAAGRYTIGVTATDSCGAVGSDLIVVDVVINRPPVISYTPKDTVYKQCQPQEICVPVGISDPDNNVANVTVSGGSYNVQTGSVCIMPNGVGSFCARITVTDKCGLSATQEVCVQVADGDRVDINCPATPAPFVLCQAQSICVDMPITGSNFTVAASYGSWSNNQLCFTADSSGSYRIRVIAQAQCNVDTCYVTVPVTILPQLSITCPANDTQFLCGADTLSYPFSYAPASATVTASAPAYLSQGQVLVPVLQPGVQTIRLTVSNQCGTTECSFTVTTTFNAPPAVSAGPDKSYVECGLHEVCVPISIVDPNNNITQRTTSAGRLTSDIQLCYTPPSYGIHQIIIGAVDACGRSDADTVIITYTEGAHAAIQCPDGTQYASVCGPDTICILAPITPSNATVTILPAGFYKPQTGEVCIPVSQGGTVAVRIIAASQCESDTCRFNLEVDMGVKPVVQCPGRVDTVLCLVAPDTLRVPVTATGTGLQVNVNPSGYYAAGYVNLPIATAGRHLFQVIAFGRCGADTCDIEVNATANKTPVLTLPGELTFERCPGDLNEICIGGIFAKDTESHVTVSKVCGPGSFVSQSGDSGAVCFLPTSFGQVRFCFEASDGCHLVKDSFLVNVVSKPDCDVCVKLSIDGGADTPVGQRKKVAINVETNDPIGGFDILLGYDKSALVFQLGYKDGGDAESWEYFTWNSNNPSCGSCPTGLVRFVGIADRNNGAPHPPDSAYTPNGTLFFVEYQVVNDQNLGDVFVPISFVWTDCSDNALSDTSGTILFIDSRIYNSEGALLWDEFDDAHYPESGRQSGLGAPDTCIVEGAKTQAVRCVEFHNGGIKIINPGDIDSRGDINLNNIAYEIADAVVFTNYFIRGMSAFTINIPGQVAATDVNADGLTLTVADLALLIRIIVGDANPMPKVTPYAEQAEVFTSLDNGTLRIGAETAHGIGAAYFVYDIAPGTTIGEPSVLPATTQFDVMAGVFDDQLHVLMYDIGTAEVAPGRSDLIELPISGVGSLTLVHSEIVDYQSRPYLSMAGAIMPEDYDLMQNYPNPFNPSTTISFALPTSADWSLKIYNITGALVWEQGGHSMGGTVDVVWDGRGLGGDPVASGVYLYRLDANAFSDTRKMILLK